MFGGGGYDASGTNGWLNDLWKWDGTAWTWMAGSNGRNELGSAGAKGVPDGANVPGSRTSGAAWMDGQGRFWLFGGLGMSQSASGRLNDLWRWENGVWTWVSGSPTTQDPGLYGHPAEPPARDSIPHGLDALGRPTFFGGSGPSNGTPGRMNDLWVFRP
jgi:hypothetical protein